MLSKAKGINGYHKYKKAVEARFNGWSLTINKEGGGARRRDDQNSGAPLFYSRQPVRLPTHVPNKLLLDNHHTAPEPLGDAAFANFCYGQLRAERRPGGLPPTRELWLGGGVG